MKKSFMMIALTFLLVAMAQGSFADCKITSKIRTFPKGVSVERTFKTGLLTREILVNVMSNALNNAMIDMNKPDLSTFAKGFIEFTLASDFLIAFDVLCYPEKPDTCHLNQNVTFRLEHGDDNST